MATTPNYSFSVYSSTDTDVRFLDFRVATAGSQSTSNFYVIDTVLKQHSDAIDSINATPSAFVVKGTYSAGSLYTASVANYPGYKNEQLIVLSLNQKNTGAVQININGTTNKDVMKYGSDGVLKAVDAGDFVANSPVLCLYDGTRFVVIGITSASSITVTGEAGDILQIADDGTIESSGKKAAQPNGIATLDENGNVVQVANMANSAAAVYSGEPVTVEYAGAQRIASITAYGENAQGGTTEAPVALTGVDSVHVCGRNLLPPRETGGVMNGITFTVNGDGSITLSGTATNRAVIYFVNTYRKIVLSKGIYTIGMRSVIPDGCSVSLGHYTGQHYAGSILRLTAGEASKSFQVSNITGVLEGYFEIKSGTTVNTTIYPMLNLGESPLPYEPYQGSVTPLPIPRPLHKVGDVRDVCRTRVKSVYDKRVVLDGSEKWKIHPTYPDSFIITYFERIVKGLSDSYLSLRLPEVGVKTGIYLTYTFEIIITDPTYSTVEELKAKLAAHPITVYYQSTAYDGTNGLDVCQTEYQTGFVELDGTEFMTIGNIDASQKVQQFNISNVLSSPKGTDAICSHISSASSVNEESISIYDNRLLVAVWLRDPLLEYGFVAGDSGTYIHAFKAYLAAQKAAGTPVQIAYQLAAPEVYATDPLTIDNAAGPLTVMTGGQVEVKMTDFVTDRTPAFLNKLDKTGDGSDVTVTFTEAATDTDIASGDKLSILFGKILKRFSTITSKFTTVDNSITQIESDISDITDGTTVVAQANKVTNALVIMSNSGTALVNYDGSATANMTLSPSNVGAEPAFTKNTAFNKNFGSSAGTVCQGNDGRLSNARRSSNITMSLSGTNLSISYS